MITAMVTSKQKMIKIIKEKGLGRYRKDLEKNGGYFSYVSLGLTNEKKYCVIFTNSYIKNFNKYIYEGNNRNIANSIFNKIIEKDKKNKQDLIHEIFSKN